MLCLIHPLRAYFIMNPGSLQPLNHSRNLPYRRSQGPLYLFRSYLASNYHTTDPHTMAPSTRTSPPANEATAHLGTFDTPEHLQHFEELPRYDGATSLSHFEESETEQQREECMFEVFPSDDHRLAYELYSIMAVIKNRGMGCREETETRVRIRSRAGWHLGGEGEDDVLGYGTDSDELTALSSAPEEEQGTNAAVEGELVSPQKTDRKLRETKKRSREENIFDGSLHDERDYEIPHSLLERPRTDMDHSSLHP